MWLENRGGTRVIKIQLIVVGNAVVATCVLKIGLDSKCQTLGTGATLGHGSQHSEEYCLRSSLLHELAVNGLSGHSCYI